MEIIKKKLMEHVDLKTMQKSEANLQNEFISRFDSKE